MRTGIAFAVTDAERRRLQQLVAAPTTRQKHVWRCAIILATDAGLGTTAIMAHTSKSKPTVWRWQQRFMAARVEGLLRDQTRPPGRPPPAAAQVQAVRTRTQAGPLTRVSRTTVQ